MKNTLKMMMGMVLSLAVVSSISRAEEPTGSCLQILGVVSQEVLANAISKYNPTQEQYVKDAPILGYRITSGSFEDIPIEIRAHLGAVDKTTYTQEYLQANIGSILALQMKNATDPDFYIVGKATFDAKYRVVDVAEVETKNDKIFKRLQGTSVGSLITIRHQNLIGALKTVPISVFRMSSLGFSIENSATILGPWGEQTKPADQDAFVTWDQNENKYYMINVDTDGLPLSYIPALNR